MLVSEVSSGVAERAKEGVLDCRKRVNRIIGEGLNRVLARRVEGRGAVRSDGAKGKIMAGSLGVVQLET